MLHLEIYLIGTPFRSQIFKIRDFEFRTSVTFQSGIQKAFISEYQLIVYTPHVDLENEFQKFLGARSNILRARLDNLL